MGHLNLPEGKGIAGRVKELSRGLYADRGFAHNTTSSTVSREIGRVRTMIMATHTKEDLGYALKVFGQVGKGMGIVE